MEREAERHAARIAGLEREQEVLRKEAEAARGIHQREALAGGVAGVDAGEHSARDRLGPPLVEARSPQAQAGQARDQRQRRARGRLRVVDVDRREHVAEDRDPAIDVAAPEQLLGGAATQIERLRRRRALGRREEHRRGVGAEAGVDKPEVDNP